MKKIKEMVTAIITGIKKMMNDYEEVYREAYKDPYFIVMEGRAFGYSMM